MSKVSIEQGKAASFSEQLRFEVCFLEIFVLSANRSMNDHLQAIYNHNFLLQKQVHFYK